jgi:hypothetical protein
MRPSKDSRIRRFIFGMSIWFLFFALLLPAGFVGWAIGKSGQSTHVTTVTLFHPLELLVTTPKELKATRGCLGPKSSLFEKACDELQIAYRAECRRQAIVICVPS